MTSNLPSALDQTIARLVEQRIIERIWQRDHTVWRNEPTELVDRLGWLDAPTQMLERLPDLERLREDVLATGYEDLVLLGMGGSSLGAEALASCLGSTPGHPRLHVLDSTVPSWVRRIRSQIDPAHTLFIAASKSGGTLEMQALRDYFWGEVDTLTHNPGPHFLAITDPGSPLDVLAAEAGYAETFRNPPDIGGRFSVLSGFGILPACLAGVRVGRLLHHAAEQRELCQPSTPSDRNPALQLGAWMGAMAGEGRDKMTLLTSPRLTTFGLWAEQLVAESTGKDGRGILPVADEPATTWTHYRDDRWFVVLRLAGDDNETLDLRVDALRRANLPVLELALTTPADLGGQLYVWQLATAVAGHLLDVHPFDQPDVQAAKDGAASVLAEFEADGVLQTPTTETDLAQAIEATQPAYVALLAYLDVSRDLEARIRRLRRRLIERFDVATTFGYGPRYLHSTGQLHKGGAGDGLFVQIVDSAQPRLAIPGWRYGFETLAAAQAVGDLRALISRQRPVVRLDCRGGPLELLDELIQRFDETS